MIKKNLSILKNLLMDKFYLIFGVGPNDWCIDLYINHHRIYRTFKSTNEIDNYLEGLKKVGFSSPYSDPELEPITRVFEVKMNKILYNF